MAKKPKSLCYVLRSFPEPSETFISEEAISVMNSGVRVSIVVMSEGNRTVIHPSSQRLLDANCVYLVSQPGRWALAKSLVRLTLQQPLKTLGALSKALRHPYRWIYFSVLPAAVWCRSRNIEYLHAHFADFNLQAADALATWLGKPFGVTTHRYDIIDDPIDANVARALFRASNLLVTISKWNVRHMIAKYQLQQSRLEIVHCGINLADFGFHQRSFAENEPFRLLNVGRLVPVKGHATLLHALAQVRGQGVTCHLDIIGAGLLEGELRRLCLELGLEQCVTFHGAQPQSFVRESLKRAHAFVLSSYAEGLPVACIEAAASGTPLIATRINGLPELIDDGISGLLVDANDAAALARAISWAATHRTALAAMTAAARRKVENEFDRTACTEQLLSLAASATGVPD